MGEVLTDFCARRNAQIYAEIYASTSPEAAEQWSRINIHPLDVDDTVKYIRKELEERGYKIESIKVDKV